VGVHSLDTHENRRHALPLTFVRSSPTMDAAGIHEGRRKPAATSNNFTNDACRNVVASFNDFINDACCSLQRWLNDAYRNYVAAFYEITNEFRPNGQRRFNDCHRSLIATLKDPANDGRRRTLTTSQRKLPQYCRSSPTIRL
jgi:hypothetical protein